MPRALAVAPLSLALLAAAALVRAQPTPQPRPARPHYALDARLDPSSGRLRGRAVIRFQNRSSAALSDLYFHLYANAFESTRTVFMREGGSRLRGVPLVRTGGIELQTLFLTDHGERTDLLPSADFELIPGDRTQLRVPLPRPLPPGAEVTLSIHFEVRLPSLVARMGRHGDFFMLAQWFPKLAKLEPDGSWASFPYHGMGEFYADFADHELRVEVPRNYVVAAPGKRVFSRDTPHGTRVERYILNDALDIAWAASPELGRERITTGRGVQLEAFAPAGHRWLSERELSLMARELARLGHRLGPYPYRRLVLVLPPDGAVGASGMEYPGLIVGATVGWHSEIDLVSPVVHDLTTAHELAHQWFPLLIASDELDAPVLDEGLSEWLGLDALRKKYGPRSWFARVVGLPLDEFEIVRAAFAAGPVPPSSLLPAFRYQPSELGPAVYARPALVLETLRRTYGEVPLWQALARYARTQRHAHPDLSDLLAAFDDSYYPGFGRQLLEPLLSGEVPSTHLQRDAPDASSAERTPLRALRGDKRALPSAVTLVRLDGTTARVPWPARQPTLVLESGPGLAGISIDADRHNLLDPRRQDDQLRLSISAPESALLPRLLLWAQLLLGAVGL